MDQAKYKSGLRWGIIIGFIWILIAISRSGRIPNSFPSLMGLLAELLLGFGIGYLIGLAIYKPAKKQP